MTSIFDEYRKFADTKVLADQEVSGYWMHGCFCSDILFSLLKRLIMKKYNSIPNISLNGYDPFGLASGNDLKKYLEIDVDDASRPM